MPTRLKGPARMAGAVTLAVLLAAALLAAPASLSRADPNYFEQRRIETQALEAFKRMVDLWREEVYFELYDYGIAASKARMSREEFAQRMVELSWVPDGELNPSHLKGRFQFRTIVYVTARLPYRHKFNPERRFAKDQTLLLQQEDGQWKVNLVDLVRAPYGGT